jgi:CheY-like chemotaxis protein
MPVGPDRGLTRECELVLVAEDDAANRALVARLLERAGYRSIAVADGR